MVEQYVGHGWQPSGAPVNVQREEHWTHFDSSLKALSFGFVATAILISMFLLIAVFERFLRPSSSGTLRDLESQFNYNPKLPYPSPKMSLYGRGVSVLMPGDDMPTFIAHPAPVVAAAPCLPQPQPQPQRISSPQNHIQAQ